MKIRYTRESLCMGDDVMAGIYDMEVPVDITLRKLIILLCKGGCGNSWSIPVAYHDCYWLIMTNIGAVAIIICNHKEEICLESMDYEWDERVEALGIHTVSACRPVEHYWNKIDNGNYGMIVQRLKAAAADLQPIDLSH